MSIESQRYIYLDYQASTPIDAEVADLVRQISLEHFGNPHVADHHYGWRASELVRESAQQIQQSLGASGYSVVFVSGATEANNLVFSGIAKYLLKTKRPGIAVSRLEHACVTESAERLRGNGHPVQHIPCGPSGIIDDVAVAALANSSLGLLSVLAVSNEIGTVQPISRLADLAHSSGALIHVDAAQAIGKIELSLDQWNADFVTISGHKCYGPKGIGALLLSDRVRSHLEPLLVGGVQQGGFRAGTVPVELCVGLARAVKIAAERLGFDREHASNCRSIFIDRLSHAAREAAVLNGSLENRVPHNLNLRFAGLPAESILDLCPGVCVSRGAACSQEGGKPSATLKALGLTPEEIEESFRVGFGRNLTVQDAGIAAEALGAAVRYLRGR